MLSVKPMVSDRCARTGFFISSFANVIFMVLTRISSPCLKANIWYYEGRGSIVGQQPDWSASDLM